MFAEVCARMFSKSTSSFQVVRWFPVSAETYEDVPTTMDIIEGPVRYRRRKKWKSRWAVLRRVNPASDVLNLVLYQDQVGARSRQKEKAFLSLETFCGLQLLNKLDKHYNIIVAITANQVVRLSFGTIEDRSEWVTHLQRHFGQEQSFDGIIPHKQKLKSGEATLRFYKNFFSLTRKDNYRYIGKWNFIDLPHYGAVYGAFAFEVKEGPPGSTSMYYFATKHGRELHQLFDSVCKGTVVVEGNYVEPPELDNTPQRSISQPNGDKSKPNVFIRAWQRVSQRKPKKKRPRSTSEPGTRSRTSRKPEENAATSRDLPKVPTDKKPDLPARPQNSDERGNSSLRRMTTPEGYEIMDDDVVDAASARKGRASRTSESSADGTVISRQSYPEKTAIAEEPDDPDGYVLVEAMDVEEIVREAERRVEEERKREMEKTESAQVKTSSDEDKENSLQNGEEAAQSPPSDTTTNVESNSKNTEDKKSNRGSEGYDNIDPPNAVPVANSQSPPKTPVRPKSLETKQEMMVNTNKSRRGMRKPPPEIVLPNDIQSPENPYVNSPPLKTVDYVNIPGSGIRGLTNGVRNRSKTTNNGKSKKLNPYEKYDGNDDSIYHSVESLLPGNPAYQNIRAESNRSHSFDNIPGHSYTNLPGHGMNGQTYQNIGPQGQQAYVNVTPRRKRFQKNHNPHNLNYIQVEGTDGFPGASGPPIFSAPPEQQNSPAKSPSSEYTWIDESRTRLLKETARMHSDLRKENLPKVSKKY